MPRVITIAIACVFAILLYTGPARPASAYSIRDTTVSDLYVRDTSPTVVELAKQFGAFWNPDIPLDPKIAVSYHGDGARPALERVMQQSTTMDFFSIQGRNLGPPKITGNTMSITIAGNIAGFPTQTLNYYYVRDRGLWKFDWKKICRDVQCQGNPNFGY